MEKLATEVGTTFQTINRLEKGETDLFHEALPKIAQAFGCRMMDLMEGYFASGESDVEPVLHDEDQGYGGIDLKPFQRLWRAKRPVLDKIGIGLDDVLIDDSRPQTIEKMAMGDTVLIELRLAEAEPQPKARRAAAVPGFAEAPVGESVLLLREYIEPDLFITNSAGLNTYPLDRKRDALVVRSLIVNRLIPVRRGRS